MVKKTEEEIEKLAKTMAGKIKSAFFVEDLDRGYSKYQVKIQDILFETAMTDEELYGAALVSYKILEELRKISQTYGRTELDAAEGKYKDQDNTFRVIKLFADFATSELRGYISELCGICRVGGAYALLISMPCFESAIYSVFDIIVDKFGDENIYNQSVFFLMRAAMRMNCDEIEKDNR